MFLPDTHSSTLLLKSRLPGVSQISFDVRQGIAFHSHGASPLATFASASPNVEMRNALPV